jgi:hypothetical protein
MLSLVIPVYRNEENLARLFQALEHLAGLTQEPAVASLLDAYAFETQIEDFAVYRRR